MSADLRRPPRWEIAVAALGTAMFLPFGIWAMTAPRSFFDQVATFEPYNQHLIQDIGAFQVGLGAVLLASALRPRWPGVKTALIGTGIGAGAHAVSHIIGRDLGGNPATDIPLFVALALVLLGAGLLTNRGTRS